MKKILYYPISIILLCISFYSCSKDVIPNEDNNTDKAPTGIVGEWVYKSTALYLEDELILKNSPYNEHYMKLGGNLRFTDKKLYYTDEEGQPYFFPYTLKNGILNFFGIKLAVQLHGDKLSIIEKVVETPKEIDPVKLTKYQVFKGRQVYHTEGHASYYIDMNGTLLGCQSYNDFLDEEFLLPEDVFYNIETTNWERSK